VIAMIMPITTNTTIAICIQIQVGDTTDSLPGVLTWEERGRLRMPYRVLLI
jgi:hypothetical protein